MRMNSSITLLAAIIGTRPLTRAMRSLWMGSQCLIPGRKRSFRFFRGNGFWKGNRITALTALRRDFGSRRKRRGEEQRMRRRPFAGFAV